MEMWKLLAWLAYMKSVFEQSWKAMKELLENFGYAEGATGSPRTIFKNSLQGRND